MKKKASKWKLLFVIKKKQTNQKWREKKLLMEIDKKELVLTKSWQISSKLCKWDRKKENRKI